MTVTPPFIQSRQKIGRAASHIKALERAIEDFFKTKWYTCDFSRAKDGQYKLNVALHGEPRDYSVTVGDAVHNLRAALDLLAVEVVDRNGGNTKSVYFPFADSAESLDGIIRRRNFHRASGADLRTLRELEPYVGGNRLLRSLHDLDIQDKHHSLIPHAALITGPKVSVKTDSSGKPVGFAEGKLELEVDTNEAPAVTFTFPDDSIFAGDEVIAVLWQLHDCVSKVVDQFAASSGGD